MNETATRKPHALHTGYCFECKRPNMPKTHTSVMCDSCCEAEANKPNGIFERRGSTYRIRL